MNTDAARRDPQGRVVTGACLGLLPAPSPTLGEAAGMREALGQRRGAHRPAQLDQFTERDLELLDTVITG